MQRTNSLLRTLVACTLVLSVVAAIHSYYRFGTGFDTPTIMRLNFEEASSMLGKPSRSGISNSFQGSDHYAIWEDVRGNILTVFYASTFLRRPTRAILSVPEARASGNPEDILAVGNLSFNVDPDDQDYSFKMLTLAKDPTKYSGARVKPIY